MNKRKMRKSAVITLIALAAVLCVALIFVIVNKKNNSANHGGNESVQEPQIIEVEGDIEIIIPDDQESTGF